MHTRLRCRRSSSCCVSRRRCTGEKKGLTSWRQSAVSPMCYTADHSLVAQTTPAAQHQELQVCLICAGQTVFTCTCGMLGAAAWPQVSKDCAEARGCVRSSACITRRFSPFQAAKPCNPQAHQHHLALYSHQQPQHPPQVRTFPRSHTTAPKPQW
jgi:hypothetical protein